MDEGDFYELNGLLYDKATRQPVKFKYVNQKTKRNEWVDLEEPGVAGYIGERAHFGYEAASVAAERDRLLKKLGRKTD